VDVLTNVYCINFICLPESNTITSQLDVFLALCSYLSKWEPINMCGLYMLPNDESTISSTILSLPLWEKKYLYLKDITVILIQARAWEISWTICKQSITVAFW